jgi:hypothetical protein
MAGRKEKVIIMTANLLDVKFEEAEVPHVVTQLQKPFRIDSFLDTVIATVKNGKHLPGMGIRQTAAGVGF